MYIRHKEKFVGVEEMQEHLNYCRRMRGIIFGSPKPPLGFKAYIEDTMTYLKITYARKEACTYIFRKDLAEVEQEITGLAAYTELGKAYKRHVGKKIPHWDDVGSARALLSYRADYDCKRVYAYGYDQNSSYGWALGQPIPDTENISGKNRVVRDGEIGFAVLPQYMPKGWINNTTDCLQMIRPGHLAEVIFPTIDSPFKRHVDIWYNRKVNSEDKHERAKAKQMIIYGIGYFQRTNPYLRATVVEHANEYILSLIDENSIYVNTDAIVSIAERPDLPLGEGIGKFKLEHKGDFAHDGFNYQWDLNTPSYRHIPKAWFYEGYDLLEDDTPDNGNFYELDEETLQLIKERE